MRSHSALRTRVATRWARVAAGRSAEAFCPAARAWQTHLQNQAENLVYDVAIGGDGSVVAGGISDLSGDLGKSFVVKLTVDGTVVWRVKVDGYGSRAYTVDVDAHGDVLVGGLADGQDESDFGTSPR